MHRIEIRHWCEVESQSLSLVLQSLSPDSLGVLHLFSIYENRFKGLEYNKRTLLNQRMIYSFPIINKFTFPIVEILRWDLFTTMVASPIQAAICCQQQVKSRLFKKIFQAEIRTRDIIVSSVWALDWGLDTSPTLFSWNAISIGFTIKCIQLCSTERKNFHRRQRLRMHFWTEHADWLDKINYIQICFSHLLGGVMKTSARLSLEHPSAFFNTATRISPYQSGHFQPIKPFKHLNIIKKKLCRINHHDRYWRCVFFYFRLCTLPLRARQAEGFTSLNLSFFWPYCLKYALFFLSSEYSYANVNEIESRMSLHIFLTPWHHYHLPVSSHYDASLFHWASWHLKAPE